MLGALIAIGSMLAYFLFLGHPIWGTNDDVFMSMVAAGVLITSQPSADLLFIHPFYGWFISQLCIWQPEVPWYGIFFILFVGLSLVILNYSILRLRRQLNFIFIAICATIITILPSLWHLQFTIVAALAILSGGMLLLSFFMCEPTTKKSFIIGILTSLCMLLIGSMIRFHSMLMVFVLFAPCATVLFLKFVRSTQCGKLKRLYIVKFLMIGIIVGVSMIGLQVGKQRYYRNSPEWTKWFSLNKAKAEFIDYGKIKYNEQTRNMFDSVGWSQNDYNMITSWQYVDPKQYALEKFIYIINACKKKGILGKTTLLSGFGSFKSNFMRIINVIKLQMRAFASLLLCILAVGLLTIRWEKWNFLYVSFIVCTTAVVLFYLYFVLQRAPYRVIVPLWASVLWMMLLVASNPNNLQVGRWKGYKTVAWIILIFMLSASVYKDIGIEKYIVEEGVEKQNYLERMIKDWNTNLPQGSVIYNVGATFPFESQLPLKSLTYLRSIKGFITTGCANQSPLQRQAINALGLDDDFYASMAQKEHVYMTTLSSFVHKDYKKKYGLGLFLHKEYKEKYGLDLSLVKVQNLPRLSRMVFKRPLYNSVYANYRNMKQNIIAIPFEVEPEHYLNYTYLYLAQKYNLKFYNRRSSTYPQNMLDTNRLLYKLNEGELPKKIWEWLTQNNYRILSVHNTVYFPKVNKFVLARLIFNPNLTYLEGDKGVYLFEINQRFSHHITPEPEKFYDKLKTLIIPREILHMMVYFSGWYSREVYPKQLPFRWMNGKHSSVFYFKGKNEAVTISFSYKNPLDDLNLYINNKPIDFETTTDQYGWKHVSIYLKNFSKEWLYIEFKTARIYTVKSDSRKFGCMITDIQIINSRGESAHTDLPVFPIQKDTVMPVNERDSL